MSSTVKLTVLYFAALREQAGKEQEEIVLDAPLDAAALYTLLAERHAFTLPQSRLRAAVNHSFCPWNTALADQDIVAFIPPIAGG